MTDPQLLFDQNWENAAALIEHFEQSVRADDNPNLLNEIVARLRAMTGAQSVALVVSEEDQSQTIARSGVAMLVASEGDAVDDRRLLATRVLTVGIKLALDLRFEKQVLFAIRQPLVELCEALLDLAANVYLKNQVRLLKQQLVAQDDRDRWIEGLYEGKSIQDSFTRIANAIANKIVVDRVSLLRLDAARPEWIASSSQATIDRRASQVRLLEETVFELTASADRFSFVRNSAPCEATTLQAYMDQSGCDQIHLEVVRPAGIVILLERFSSTADDEPLASVIDPYRQWIYHAVGVASSQDKVDWRQLANLCSRTIRQFNTLHLAAGIGFAFAAATLIQVPLKIPVDGKVTAVDCYRIYAPADGIVDEVMVGDGDRVKAGDNLIRLRSPALDLQQRSIEGTLATTRTRLDSLKVSRDDRQPTHSTDEKILKSEIAGLEQQLSLIQQQQSSLVVASPIAGRVDCWDLRSTLIARPVAVGQFLLRVASDADVWEVQLNIPDQQVGYLLERQQLEPCVATFRLRSNATVVHRSEIETISASAHIDASGQSIVIATLPFPKGEGSQVRDGATVLAQVHCGNHPIGFVWLRGLIEWWRSSSWF